MIRLLISYLQSVLQSRVNTRKARAESLQLEAQIQKQNLENYGDILQRLQDARKYMEERADYYRKELDERRKETSELREQIMQLEARLNHWLPQVCTNVACEERQMPPVEG